MKAETRTNSVLEWTVLDQGTLNEAMGGFVFAPANKPGNQGVTAKLGQARGKAVRISMIINLSGIGDDLGFYVASGNKQLILLKKNGEINSLDDHWLLQKKVIVNSPSEIILELEYISADNVITLGVRSTQSLSCQGRNGESFSISNFQTLGLMPVPKKYDLEFTVLDVGARGGLQPHWERLYLSGEVVPIFVEPEPVAAKILRRMYPDSFVIEEGLSDVFGQATLFITRVAGCSSLLVPDARVLSRYKNARNFEIATTKTVNVRPFRALKDELKVPDVDFVKIDVQGLEYEVLRGMIGAMDSVLAIELEAQFYPVYRDQKLLGDIVELLDGLGFGLSFIRRMGAFEEFVEVNAWFVRRGEATMDAAKKCKLQAIREMLKLR